jgi:hypothetical protein
VKWYGKYGRKVGWKVKRYGKYGRKLSWIVKWYGKYERKVGWIVKRYGKYVNVTKGVVLCPMVAAILNVGQANFKMGHPKDYCDNV